MYLGDCARLEEGGLLRRDGAGAFLGLLGVGLGAAFGGGGGGGGFLRGALGHIFECWVSVLCCVVLCRVGRACWDGGGGGWIACWWLLGLSGVGNDLN